jgi:hypothetical protein
MRLDTLLSIISVLAPLALARPWKLSDGCPSTIKTTVSSDPCSYGEDSYRCTKEPQFSTMETVHLALSKCPNITELDLRVTGLGCSEWPDRYNFPFQPAGGEKYPRLKSLRLEGYQFGKRSWGREAWEIPKIGHYDWRYDWFWWVPDGTWSGQMATWVWEGHWKTWMQWRTQPQEQREKTNLGLWLDAMDWSGIEELMVVGKWGMTDEVIEKLPSRLPSLTKLEATNVSFINALDNNTLTHLKFVDEYEPHDLSSILEHQGQSLQSLEFRCEELSCRFTPDFDLDFAILPNKTRNLTHLSINVPRNGTWPLESLQTIASLPHLQSAELYMNIQSECVQQRPEDYGSKRKEWDKEHGAGYCEGEDQFQQPFVDVEGANKMFGHMKEHNPSGELANVTFWVGDWSRPWDGPLYFPDWAEGRRSKVVCKDTKISDAGSSCVVENGAQYWRREDVYSEYWDAYVEDVPF